MPFPKSNILFFSRFAKPSNDCSFKRTLLMPIAVRDPKKEK